MQSSVFQRKLLMYNFRSRPRAVFFSSGGTWASGGKSSTNSLGRLLAPEEGLGIYISCYLYVVEV